MFAGFAVSRVTLVAGWQNMKPEDGHRRAQDFV